MKLHCGGVGPCPADAKHPYGRNAPTSILLAALICALLLIIGCEEEEAWIQDPTPYLETDEFPGCFARIPLFGVDGHNGLRSSEKPLHCSAYGVYVSSGPRRFLRSFNDSVLFHVPLDGVLPYTPEVTVVQVNGKAVLREEPLLTDFDVVSMAEASGIYVKVIDAYPKIVEKIAEKLNDPKSKLDFTSIETFHCAASDDQLLIFGRTYDLMYEFDLGFLFEKQGEKEHESGKGHEPYVIKRIFAHHFFKGE